MLKTVSKLFFVACLYFATPAIAQKTDSVKIDTNLLNRYRIEPRRNGIPTRVRPAVIHEEQVPVSMMDYKINYWRKWITFGINLNQSAFSNNWSAGGVSSLAIGGNFNYKTEYNKAPFNYVGELNTLYGRVTNKGQIARKTNDRLFFDNKIATQLSKNWFFFSSLTFESQFDKGFQYPNNAAPVLISSLMSPGYLTESVGIEYKPNKIFDLRIGTGTARQTFVLDTTMYKRVANNYGVTPGRTFKNDLAFQVVATYDKDIMQNMHLSARYNCFIPYGQGWINIDHRLDAVLIAKVNKLFNINITGTVLFDNQTSPKPQATEGFALGVIYKFP